MFLYLVLPSHFYEWEDLFIIENEKEAIEYSINHPNVRIEIFNKLNNDKLYKPTYKYYKNGI